MSEPDQPRQETEALRERISRLSAAILRTSASLNVAPSCTRSSKVPAR